MKIWKTMKLSLTGVVMFAVLSVAAVGTASAAETTTTKTTTVKDGAVKVTKTKTTTTKTARRGSTKTTSRHAPAPVVYHDDCDHRRSGKYDGHGKHARYDKRGRGKDNGWKNGKGHQKHRDPAKPVLVKRTVKRAGHAPVVTYTTTH